MGAIWPFIRWALAQAWRYGSSVVSRVVSWAKSNWRTVYRWILDGIAFTTIFEWIRRKLGI